MSHRTAEIGAAIFLTAHAALLGWAATKHSPSTNEVGHMAAGLSHWRFGNFDLYRVNPPLVRLVATAPVALLYPRAGWNDYLADSHTPSHFSSGEQFIAKNGERSFWFFTVARWACIPYSLLGGYVCYRWAEKLYGAVGGLLVVALWCFCPNILAHGQMVTPDLGATSVGITAWYTFWRWLRQPTWTLACTAGMVLGIAELAKATFLILYPVLVLAWIVWRIAASSGLTFRSKGGAEPGGHPRPTSELDRITERGRAKGTQLALIAAISVYVLNLGYAFEGSLQPLGEYDFVSKWLGGERNLDGHYSSPRNRFAGTVLAGLRVPLPANYVLGIDRQKFDFEIGFDSYLRGKWRHGGWWYYYLYGLAIKVPLGTWGLFLLAATIRLVELRRWMHGGADHSAGRPHSTQCIEGEREVDLRRVREVSRPRFSADGVAGMWRDEVVLLLPAAVILALVSSQTGFNCHLRYVLPIFPFVFIWIGRLGPHLGLGVRRFIAASKVGSYQDGGNANSAACHGGYKQSSKMLTALAGVALAWSIGSSLWCYPHSLSYFNELVGGPLGGRWHMLDSNIDWGQDLLYLKQWLGDRPDARPLGLAYFGFFDPRAAGIEFTLPPRQPAPHDTENGRETRKANVVTSGVPLAPSPGWYAVSVMMLHGSQYRIPDGNGGKFYAGQRDFTYFQRFEPVATAGYSIYIFHLEPPEVERVRRELGLASGSEASSRGN